VRGVTYGTFRPNDEGFQYPDRAVVEEDFARMAESGFNSVRLYTPPPEWVLDTAKRYGLYAMIGLCWEQHVAFLAKRHGAADIEKRIRESVRSYAGHPAVLCHAVGNEIPAPVVRWHGRRALERFIRRLYRAVKEQDPECPVTYVNFPTTEYLDLPFLDLCCFNVYLENRDRLEDYLARLHNIAGERPVLMAELGSDSRRNGETRQADKLSWQIEAASDAGCAGAFVFTWTDEWFRGGSEITDWDFGLVRRDRKPKPALKAVARTLARVPFPPERRWPRVSVIVCTYNGRRTIRECFEALQRLDYPDYEVIVVSDGSNDGCVALAYGFGLRVIAGPNRGLSEARNIGFRAATGDIVAYIDDDAYPDPHWLRYVSQKFLTTSHAAVGGPNLAPAGSGWVADCVANAPGGPSHVLVSDLEAEHIPGCNMAYRKRCLEELGGFDAQFRIAGDDVDLCWRLLERGWTIGFSPAAMVWHHRRNSVRAYWRQQKNYGKAEAMLERKWPAKFSSAGHPAWAGRVYGKGHTAGVQIWRTRIYQGIWGSAPFQAVYEPPATMWEFLPLMPEWYLVNAALTATILLGLLWTPLLGAAPLLALTAGIPLLQAVTSAFRADFPTKPLSQTKLMERRALTALLHMLQPFARLWGRLTFGLSPWRVKSKYGLAWPVTRRLALWSENWRSPEERLQALLDALKAHGAAVELGGDFDRWDLEIRGGLLGSARVLMMAEDHAAGRQLIRFRLRPRACLSAALLVMVFAALAAAAVASGATLAGGALGVITGIVAGRTLLEQSAAVATGLAGASHLAREQALVPLPAKAD
jgi:GT2 family glycosyltransferase